MEPIQQATPEQIHHRLQNGENLLLIDVREPEEIAVAALPAARVYPLSRAEEWIDSLPMDRPLVIFCHHGIRSMHVARVLVDRGYRNITNLAGGIDLWSAQVDPSVPRY